ncbi:hypothetical protein [Aestuariivita sp.]|jgi:hypothetical protein|uniref:hypothetical protein n=1 Tax=Aestuariivita sp. TaxID=1872407 RepID=UPI00216FDACD|nr:hypothetical protein [Aestuariivita sp.]MCE8007233.1 hypothetical protein [Aestuariivita sp.]
MKWIARGFGILVVLALVADSSSYLWATRNIPATHQTLAEADLPGLIPVWDFWIERNSAWEYKPSVAGEYVAFRAVWGLSQVVTVQDTATRTDTAHIEDVDHIFWSDIAPALYAFIDTRMWRIDPAEPAPEAWQDITPRGFRGYFVENRVTGPDELWLVSSRDRNPAFSDLFTTRQDGSGKTLQLENEGQTLGWSLDAALTPVLRFDRMDDDRVDVLKRVEDEWQSAFTVDPLDTIWVREVVPADGFELALSSRARDTVALVQFDLAKRQETVLAAHETVDFTHSIDFDPHDG